MRQILLSILILGTISLYGQNISSINSAAVSGTNLSYTVGEVFVLPETNSDKASSGMMGLVSQIEFFVTGINDRLLSDDFRAYPNPTNGSLFFSIEQHQLYKVSIYNSTGKLISVKETKSNKIDLTNLKPDVYLIKTDNPKIKSFKIIKK